MKINFVQQGKRAVLQIDDCRIIHRNFEGRKSMYNKEGDRNFSVVINDQEIADQLMDAGYNVRIKPPREEGDSPFMYLPVKVKFNDNGPLVYLVTNDKMTQLNADTVSCLDKISIRSVDLDINPYDWTVTGNSGRSAYLGSMRVVQSIDRFMQEYNDVNTER